MEKEFLANTADGYSVYYEPSNSHAATHFADSPKLKETVIKHLPNINLEGKKTRVEIDTGEIVGLDGCVETSDRDEIVYALRPHRDRYSRFVKNRAAEPTSWIVVSVEKEDDDTATLYTAFVGRLTPSFPGGDFLSEQSKEYWSKHALAWGSQEVLPETVTSICPW